MVPPGFAVTTRAYLETLTARNLASEIRTRIEAVTEQDVGAQANVACEIQEPDQVGAHPRSDRRRNSVWL